MNITMDPNLYKGMISRCKRNIDYVARLNYSDQEKQDLIETYQVQIRKWQRKLLSFSQSVKGEKLPTRNQTRNS